MLARKSGQSELKTKFDMFFDKIGVNEAQKPGDQSNSANQKGIENQNKEDTTGKDPFGNALNLFEDRL